MGVGVSLMLIAAGAILAWAVDVSTSGFNVNTIGYILLVVGIIGLILSMIFWSSWAGPGYFMIGRNRTAQRLENLRSERLRYAARSGRRHDIKRALSRELITVIHLRGE